MPIPKRRHSKTRTAKRRTHDALRAATTGLCPQCHEPKASHPVCPHCGYHKQRQVRAVDEEQRRSMFRIAVDAMGGDHAPANVVDGAVAAARHLDVHLALVGPTPTVEAALDSHSDWRSLGIEVVEAPEVIGMADSPAAALRRKPRASIR